MNYLFRHRPPSHNRSRDNDLNLAGKTLTFGRYIVLAVCWAVSTTVPATTDSFEYRPSLLQDEFYSEGWDQLFYFTDGSLLVVQVTVTNIGLGNQHAGIIGMLVTPDGQRTMLKNSRSHGDWLFSDHALNLEIAGHRLSGSHPHYEIAIRKSTGEIEVEFDAQAPPWRLGRSVEFDNEYHRANFYAPLLTAHARYRFDPGGSANTTQWRQLSGGRGFAARYIYSTGIYKLVQSAMRIVAVEDAQLMPVIYVVRDARGGERTHLALFENGVLIHELQDFELTTQYAADPDHRETPRKFYLNVKNEEFALNGAVRFERFLVRLDPVDMLKPHIRVFVKLLNTPIQYRYLARYDLNYIDKHGMRRLEGKAIMDYVVLRYSQKEDEANNNDTNRSDP